MVCPVQNSGNPDLLLDYCARRLDADMMAAITRHMVLCPECREFAEAQQQIWTALDAWDAEPVSTDFDRRLYSRISEDERRSFWSRIVGDRFSWKPALSFGAACAALAVVFIVSDPERRSPVAAEQGLAQVEALEPEQIERSVEDLEMLRQFSTTGAAAKQSL